MSDKKMIDEETFMRGLSDVKHYFEEMKAGRVERNPFRTHFFELLLLMKAGVTDYVVAGETNYTNDSLVSSFKFVDGKMYQIEIREIEVKK